MISLSLIQKKQYGIVVKKINSLDQNLMKWMINLMILLKNLKINNFIHLNIDVYQISDLKKWKIPKKLFYQLHSVIWDINLSFRDWVKKSKMQKKKCFRFDEIVKKTIKMDSSITKVNMLFVKITNAYNA